MVTNAEDVDPDEPEAPKFGLPMMLKPTDAAKYMGVGRQWFYDQVASGAIFSIRLNRKILVPVRALDEWLTRQMEGEAKGDA